MKIFVLVHKKNENYEPLINIKGVTAVEFIFNQVSRSYDDYKTLYQKIEMILDTAGPDDKIVLNGPAWLVALGGYVWFTRDNAPQDKKFGILQYHIGKETYVEMQGALP